jgi:hypothetical protein
MSGRRLPRLLLAALLVGAAAAAAVLLNLVLLGRASAGNDPVGQLRPRLATVPSTPAAPALTIRPTRGTIENEGADD